MKNGSDTEGRLSSLLLEERRYDDTPDGDEFFRVRLMPDVSDANVKMAEEVAPYARGGLMVVTGMPRQGKGTFSYPLAWKIRHCFGKRIIMDQRPRSLFDTTKGNRGPYQFFNETMFVQELEKMGKLALGELAKDIAPADKELVHKVENMSRLWLDEKGVMFRNAVLVLDEFWRYMNRRRPHNPMGILLAGLIKLWGHLDLTIIGMAQKLDELDRYTCLPYIDYHVECSWMMTRPNTVRAKIYRRVMVGSSGVHMVTGKPRVVLVDGAKPREYLDGNGWFNVFRSKADVKMLPSKMPRIHELRITEEW